MNREEALSIFGIQPTDTAELTDLIEYRLFDLRNEILAKYMVPLLMKNKLALIARLAEAEAVLLGTPESAVPHEPLTVTPGDRIQFITDYEVYISKLKLELSSCQDFATLLHVTQSLILTQEYYMVVFRMMFNEFSEALPEEVNTREIIDTGPLLLALKNDRLDDKTSWAIEREIARIEKIQALK